MVDGRREKREERRWGRGWDAFVENRGTLPLDGALQHETRNVNVVRSQRMPSATHDAGVRVKDREVQPHHRS